MYHYKNISTEQAKRILESKSCIVFDIRDDNSYKQGKLLGALRFNDQMVLRMRKSGERNAPILIYCYHGNSSKDIAQMLCNFGFSNVYNLVGGYTEWKAKVSKQFLETPIKPHVKAQDVAIALNAGSSL